jgi:hypothetical protein
VTVERKIHNLRIITSNVNGIKIQNRDCPPVIIAPPPSPETATQPRGQRIVIDRGGTRRI